jgi:hypothetical protein
MPPCRTGWPRPGSPAAAGLIAWPAAEPVFRAELAGAARPPWTPRADPREQALAAGYQFLLDTAASLAAPGLEVMRGWS